MRRSHPSTAEVTLPRIALPPDEEVTQEEIERRRALFAKAIALREAIGPIGILSDDLVHQGREDADATGL